MAASMKLMQASINLLPAIDAIIIMTSKMTPYTTAITKFNVTEWRVHKAVQIEACRKASLVSRVWARPVAKTCSWALIRFRHFKV